MPLATVPVPSIKPQGRQASHLHHRASGNKAVGARGVTNEDGAQQVVEEDAGEGQGGDEAKSDGTRHDGEHVAADVGTQAPPPPSEPEHKKRSRLHPQERIARLWRNYEPEYQGKVTRILPDASLNRAKSGPVKSLNAAESYKQAREKCEADVRKIIDECVALNQRYSDPHFDLESDLKVTQLRDCLNGLVREEDSFEPYDVKRVTDLYDNPKFFSDGAGFDDIVQGAIGDCWMMSAFSVLSCSESLIRKICVIQDQDVGVYGFVFFRDGEWHPTVIDDKLYLSSLAYDESINNVLSSWGKEQEEKYTELFQRGSKALYFAKCRDDNETWVPLLEKALAKAHGGYDALRGGQTGEAIEDLTGGVTTEIYTTNILSKEKFWNNELRKIGREFMFDATDPVYREWLNWDESSQYVSQLRKERRRGVVNRHAYAVLDTYEGYGERLVKVRNPWGESEWDGAWSDGSSQWTSVWLDRLGHKFGDDGVFWMSYKDFLNNYKHLNRTRIFDDSWYTAQEWASVQVPFDNSDYQQTKFTIDVPEDTETVIVLSQLDSRYFCGLEGKYDYTLQFRVSKSDSISDYIARSRPNYELERSTNVELYLKKGTYTVLMKVTATDYDRKDPEEVIKVNLPHRRTKVTTIGRLYDLAHLKGMRPDEDEEAANGDTSAPDTNTDSKEPASQALPTPASTPAPDVPVTPSPVVMGPPPDMAGPGGSHDGAESDDEDEKDPWNAACVVGLRVYSKTPELSVKVIWPPRAKKEIQQPVLDRDAITKAPQEEAEKNAAEATAQVNEADKGGETKEDKEAESATEKKDNEKNSDTKEAVETSDSDSSGKSKDGAAHEQGENKQGDAKPKKKKHKNKKKKQASEQPS